jgi:hypothetical protein
MIELDLPPYEFESRLVADLARQATDAFLVGDLDRASSLAIEATFVDTLMQFHPSLVVDPEGASDG